MKKIITALVICLLIFCVWYFYPCLSFKGTYSRNLYRDITQGEVECVVVGDKYYEALVSEGEVLWRESSYYDYQLKPLQRMIIVDRHSVLTPKDYRSIKLGWNKIYEWNHNKGRWKKSEKVKDKMFIQRISSENIFPKKDSAISGKWESTLSEHLTSIDKLEVLEFGAPALTITDIDDIHRLIETIEVDEDASTFRCGCLKPKTFIFKEGTNQLATIFYHTHDFDKLRETTDDHQIYLYWRYGKWPNAYAVLTAESSKQFAEWLTEHNLKIK